MPLTCITGEPNALAVLLGFAPTSAPALPLMTPTTKALLTPEEVAVLLGVDRKTLLALAARFPGLPGSPVDIGVGRRQHLRWSSDTVSEWLIAIEAERRSRRSRPAPTHRAPRRLAPTPTKGVDWTAVGAGRE